VNLRDRARQFRAIGQRSRMVGLLAVGTGAVTGAGVALFDRVVDDGLFEHLLDAPRWVQALGPALGLTIAAVVLRYAARGASPSTADEYIKNFHDIGRGLDLAPVPGRLAASIATLGAGAAMGYEGPSIYLGAAVGAFMQRRFSRAVALTDTKALLVCGAAAGVAAIFRAPATGMVFALEVPYRQDLARRMLLPAMFAAASSYVVMAAINGTRPLFPVAGSPPFDLRDLGGAALLGLLCGAGARGHTELLRVAKDAAARVAVWIRIALAGSAAAALFVMGRAITGRSLAIGPGYDAIRWSLEPHHAMAAILAIFLVRALATVVAVGGGGVGGLFIPLVVQGALLGSAMSTITGASTRTLFPLVGVAAFLGAGYRVPLAAVMFVAESTGRPGFVVPGLIAAATSQLLMARASASSYQRDER